MVGEPNPDVVVTDVGFTFRRSEAWRIVMMPQGWVCPVCGQVNAPFVAKCDGLHQGIAASTSEPYERCTCYDKPGSTAKPYCPVHSPIKLMVGG